MSRKEGDPRLLVSALTRLKYRIGSRVLERPWSYAVYSPPLEGNRRFSVQYIFRERSPAGPKWFLPAAPPMVDAEGRSRPEVSAKIHAALTELHPLFLACGVLPAGSSTQLRERIQLLGGVVRSLEETPLSLGDSDRVRELREESWRLEMGADIAAQVEGLLDRNGWRWDSGEGMPVRKGRGRPLLMLSRAVELLGPPLAELAPGDAMTPATRSALAETLRLHLPPRYQGAEPGGKLDSALQRCGWG